MILKVEGMTCGHCEGAVRRAILTRDPAAAVAIDRAAGEVRVSGARDAAALIAAIAAEGYRAHATD
jgi:copper chaperone